MGKISTLINHYLSDNRRFADLFNGICFQGKSVIHAKDLQEASQVYHEVMGETGKRRGRKERIRDICKLLKTGTILRVLALENQELTDYTMPFRCTQYDVMEYEKQLLQRNCGYRHLDADTLETMSVMLDMPSIWRDRKKYMEKNDENKEVYNMCQAVREWAEEERSIGYQEGADERTHIIVRNMLMRGMADEVIMAIAECDQGLIEKVRKTL